MSFDSLGENPLEGRKIARFAEYPELAVGSIEDVICVSAKSYALSSGHDDGILEKGEA